MNSNNESILKKYYKKRKTETILMITVILYCTLVGIVNPDFLSFESVFDILRSLTGIAIVSMGLLMVLISGGIDVSFMAVAISSAYASITLLLYLGIDSLWLAFIFAGVIGILLGMFNGLVIHFFKLPTLIATLATQSIIHGVLTTVVGTSSITASRMPYAISKFGSALLWEIESPDDYIYGPSVFMIPLIIIIGVTWYILNKTLLGRSIYAMGSNQVSAYRAGINLLKIRLFIYSYMGMTAAIMGILSACDVRWINPITMVGEELFILAAVVIGGAKLTGGSGTVLGVILGVSIISILNNTLVFLGLTASWNNFFIGLIILISVCFSYYTQMKRKKASLNFN